MSVLGLTSIPSLGTSTLLAAASPCDTDSWVTLDLWAEALHRLPPDVVVSGLASTQTQLSALLRGRPEGTGWARRLEAAAPVAVSGILAELRRTELAEWLRTQLTAGLRDELARQTLSLTLLMSGESGAPLALWNIVYIGGQVLTAHVPLTPAMDSEKGPRDHFRDGLELETAGQVMSARNAYRQVFAIDPDVTEPAVHIAACLNMARLYLLENNYQDAAMVLRRAIELDPQRPEVRNNYAVALLGMGHLEAALLQWSLALRAIADLTARVRDSGQATTGLPEPLDTLYPQLPLLHQECCRSLAALVEKLRASHQYELALAAAETLARFDQGDEGWLETVRALETAQARAAEVRPIDTIDDQSLSRVLSYALRHHPEEFELEMNSEGWVLLAELLAALRQQARWSTLECADIEALVRAESGASEGRHEIQGERIRARYGHSVPVRPNLRAETPPRFLYHGTDRRYLRRIMNRGLEPMKRQHVHLSTTREKALRVARRKGNAPVILVIYTPPLIKRGIQFYPGSEAVWLTESLPPEVLDVED